MLNNELKGKNGCYLLAHADILFTAESEHRETRTNTDWPVPESSTVVYRLINNGIFVHCLYRQKPDHVRNKITLLLTIVYYYVNVLEWYCPDHWYEQESW